MHHPISRLFIRYRPHVQKAAWIHAENKQQSQRQKIPRDSSVFISPPMSFVRLLDGHPSESRLSAAGGKKQKNVLLAKDNVKQNKSKSTAYWKHLIRRNSGR